MMAKMEIKTDSLERLEEIVEETKLKYEELVETNPGTTYTLFVNKDKMTVNIKVLDIGVQVN